MKCAWFAHLIARMSWLIWWNSEIDLEKVGREREQKCMVFPPDSKNVLVDLVEL